MAIPSLKLTKEDIKKEIIRCGRDPVYFISNYCYVQHPTKGVVRFNLYDFQKQIIRDVSDYRFNVILKARQLGVSTVSACFSLWMMLFHRGQSILICATKEKVAVNVVKKCKLAYKRLPSWLKVSDLTIDNKNSFELENSSWIRGSSTSDDVGRSEALSLLIIDEAAIIKNLEDLWPGLYNTVSEGGKILIMSTPLGASGLFYKIYTDSLAQKNDFHSSFYDWRSHPNHDQTWFDHEVTNMSRAQVAQELLGNFNMSGETVFDPEMIEWMEKTHIREPLYHTGFDRNLWVWEGFNPEEKYFIAADCARGDATDYSVAVVLKIGLSSLSDKMEIVASYQGKTPPDLFSNFLHNLGKEYGNALLVVENNTVGFAVVSKLQELQYPNLYYSEKGTHNFVESYEAETSNSGYVAGFSTTSKTRPLIVSKMEEDLRNKLLIFHDARLLNECRTFIFESGRPQSQRGYNDDLVIATCIGCYVKDLIYATNTVEMSYKKAFLSSIFVSNTTLNTKVAGQAGAPLTAQYDQSLKDYQEYNWIYVDMFKK